MGTEATDLTPEQRREQQQAMVYLDTWGSTTYPPEEWSGYGYAETDYAPEWALCDGAVPELPERATGSRCVTVLHCGWSEPRKVAGYTAHVLGPCGERECPECEATGLGRDVDGEPMPAEKCRLCEGDKYIYWGEEWSLVVYVQIDPNETITKMREIAADHDMVGALYGQPGSGNELARLFRDLDAYLGDNGQLPEAWDL
jgi:hypothetical protein